MRPHHRLPIWRCTWVTRIVRVLLLATSCMVLSPGWPGRARAEDAPAVAELPPARVALSDPLPYGLSSIDYLGARSDDAVALLARRLAAKQASLQWKPPHGYLESLLESLDVPRESQLLVFSKTALNPALVTPKNPRAIYFNDEVTVGWVPGADALELTALDPVKGPLFYTLKQDGNAPPNLRREERCLACHVGTTTLSVPGLIVRSFVPDDTGKPIAGYSRITHDSAFVTRFGGWYVTGTHGDVPHSGNLFGRDASDRFRREPLAGANRTQLPDSIRKKYLQPHSDLVAHLVLQHQAHGLNLITRVGYEARLSRESDAEDLLVRYLLFADEPAMDAPLKGTSDFSTVFTQTGSRDRTGRSLRQLNLTTRLFEHRLSFLIGGRGFESLPRESRQRVLERIYHGLTGRTSDGPAKHIPAGERTAILEIVRGTLHDLPPVWSARQMP